MNSHLLCSEPTDLDIDLVHMQEKNLRSNLQTAVRPAREYRGPGSRAAEATVTGVSPAPSAHIDVDAADAFGHGIGGAVPEHDGPLSRVLLRAEEWAQH